MKKDDIIVEHDDLSEFEITEDFSVVYSLTHNSWFIEDYSEDGKIIILEDTAQNILFEDDFVYKDEIITKDQIEKYKEIVRAD